MKAAETESCTIPSGDSLVPLESILCTEELDRRPTRPPDYETENGALAELVQALADSPRTILQTLTDTMLKVFNTESTGISLLTKDGKRFKWAAIAGAWRPHLGEGTPRDFGPCGDVLDCNTPLLFKHWERRYPYLAAATPLAEEGLLIPFYVEGKAVGTIWAIAHDENRKFDAEDLRQLESLGRFASAAYQTVASLEVLEQRSEALRKSDIELASRNANAQSARDSRRAALNLMQDAIQSRQTMENLNTALGESEKRLTRELAATRELQSVSALLIEGGHTEALYQKIVDAAVIIMQSDMASMQMLFPERNDGRGELLLLSHHGFNPEAARFWEWVKPTSESTCAVALRTGERCIVPDVEKYDFMAGSEDLKTYLQAGIHAVQSTPLISRGGRLLGIISTHWRKPHTPTERDLAQFDILARQAADLVERKHAEETLRESEEQFRAIFNQTTGGIAQTDLTGRFVLVNERYCQLVGRSREELLMLRMQDITHPEDLADDSAKFSALAEGHGKSFVIEKRYVRPDHSEVWVHNDVSRIRDAEGNVRFIAAAVTDITERKQAEAALATRVMQQKALYQLASRANRARDLNEICDAALDAILTALPCERAAILLADEKGVMSFTAWRGLSDDYRAAVKGHSPWLPNQKDPQSVCIGNIANGDIEERLRRALQQEGIVALAFIPLLHKDRLIGKFMAYWNAPNPCGQADIQVCETIATTLTWAVERIRAEEALRSAKDALANEATHLEQLVAERTADLTVTNKQLEAFVYSIAHDLRAPLRAMQGFSSMLVEEAGAALNETGRNHAQRINKSAQFMDALLRDLLAFSRISQQHLELTSVNLEPVVESVLSRLQSDIEQKNARVETSGPWPDVLAHEPTLAQALFNLVSNALKFVAPDTSPVVRVHAEEKPKFVRVWVEDNGIGIAADYQEQIFRLFTRLHGEKYQGTGLGLAIVQKGVERMGGHAGVESAVGQGSRFWFELKKAQANHPDGHFHP